MRSIRFAFALVTASLFATSAPAAAQASTVDAFGVLRPLGGIIHCLAFESDAGHVYRLGEYGGREAGDRVHVSGAITGVGLCGSLIVDQLDGNTISAAFSGIGRIQGGKRFVAEDGGTYLLASPTGYPSDVDLFVQGRVLELAAFSGSSAHVLLPSAIGAGLSTFGRLVPMGSDWWIEGPGGTYQLERMGVAFADQGDYVFVEGLLDDSVTPPRLLSNTTRPASELWGQLVPDATNGLALIADGVIFDDSFTLDDDGGFQAGDRVFVRGRGLDDFDPLEPRSPNFVRRAKVAQDVSRCGRLVMLGPDLVFQPDGGGPTVSIEHAGGFLPGADVFVAGALAPGVTPLAFEHNLILRSVTLSGTLELGFECAPLFVAQETSAGLSYYMLENLGGFQLGDSLCVKGAVSACTSQCPFPCIVANTAMDCP